MDVRRLLVNLAKLLLGGILFFVGTQIGGAAASLVGLQAAPMAPGATRNLSLLYSLLLSPLLAFALACLARGLAGSFVTRASILSFLAWIAYAVCDQLEGLLVSTYSTGFRFAIVESLVASLLCGGAVAWLFSPAQEGKGFGVACKAFFASRRAGAWLWRIVLAAVAFVPIYFIIGLLVLPFVRHAYEQGLYGLQEPAVDRLFTILLVRSVLFAAACLPVLIAWQGSRRSLFPRLGAALFLLVAWPSIFTAYWLPWSLRGPHTLEILADEFIYSGVLVALLTKNGSSR
jgi:hypothetical protein